MQSVKNQATAGLAATKATAAGCVTAALLMCAMTAHAQTANANVTAPGITDLTIFHVKPARAADFLDVMKKNVLHSRTEDGNLRFDAYSQTNGAALTVYVVEVWRDASAQKQHAQQPTLLALHQSFAQDLIGRPQSSVVNAVAP